MSTSELTINVDMSDLLKSIDWIAIRDVIQERHRQIKGEGWAPEHDDEHDPGELAAAGAAYAINAADHLNPLSNGDGGDKAPECWPWFNACDVSCGRGDTPVWAEEPAWWKPKDPRRDLVRAAALIIAEIDRLDRAEARKADTP